MLSSPFVVTNFDIRSCRPYAPPCRHGLPRNGTILHPALHPACRSRNEAVRYDKRRYKRRSRIEIMFGRVATRYDRCPTTFFSAIVLAATVIFWL
jgi:hypothetical protein